MHPVSSIVRASELRQQEILAEAAYETLCARVAGRNPGAGSGDLTWVLRMVVVMALALIAAVAGGGPAALVRFIAGRH